MSIDTFLGSGVSVSEQVGIRPVFNHMFLGSAVGVCNVAKLSDFNRIVVK